MPISIPRPLPPDSLCRRTDASAFAFATTEALDEIDGWPGQARAVEAVKFGVAIKRGGYNIVAIGVYGAGKQTFVRTFVDERAAAEPVPDDWCYVNHFTEAHRPRALRLPPGRGLPFQRDMDRLIEELQIAIPAALEADDSRAALEAIENEFRERNEEAFGALQKKAMARNIALVRTPVGMALAPTQDGEVVGPEAFQKLPQDEQERIRKDIEELQQELEAILRQLPKWAKEQREKVRALHEEIVGHAVGHLIDDLRRDYRDLPEVLEHLGAVQDDVIRHGNEVIAARMAQQAGAPQQEALTAALGRYRVNLLIDHTGAEGAPVIYEDHPTHGNLIGRIEYVAQMGALVTDFSLIKPGAFHNANGGYLVLDLRAVLMQPFAWEQVKRTIKSGDIRIETLGQSLSLISTVSLEPEPIPVDVKVVLIADRMLYYMLCAYDPEFPELFKVTVDVVDEVDRDPETTRLFARFVAGMARRAGLRPLDPGGVARVLDDCARRAGDAEKFACHRESISDLLNEADYWAGASGEKVIGAAAVQQAVDAQIRRVDRLRERGQEAIRRKIMLVDTDGTQVGQVNGLTVLQLGGFAFGRPARITARVQLGKGDVIDIERQVELGGPIHSKGVLILSGFLGGRFGIDRPMALRASLVFEQSYGGVEGDSASSAELYALLSALSDVPIRQSLAVTGSVNQHGRVQAIGGVNEKIEGFFDVCRDAGLTGTQGVLIPAANVKHLMLRQDVVDAAASGQFHIYPVETIDQGIELLTGVPAGERGEDGAYPEGSINALVERRLEALTAVVKRYSAKDDGKDDGKDGIRGVT